MPRKDKNLARKYSREYQRNYRKEQWNRYRNEKLIYDYGISLEYYNDLFEKQNGCCAICGKHQSELKQSLSVDHDHITRKVRGLLCPNCNHGIGLFQESVKFLIRASDYLKLFEK